MKLRLISVGGKMPAWVETGFREYRDRFPASMPLELIEIPLGERGKRDAARAMEREGQRMLKAISADAHVVALDVPGKAYDTEGLARRLEHWRQQGRDVALLIGGPDGLTSECRQRADEQWSLSPLTLPHMLVRIIVAEQLYRAWTVLQNHPYHRC